MMRKTRAALSIAIVGLAALTWAAFTSRVESQQGARPQYTSDGKMLQLPAGFETWVFVGSNLGLAYKPEMTVNDGREANRARDQQFFHNVYINPEAYAHFATTKEFLDPTILVMEVFVPEDRDPRGVLKSGVYNGQRVGIEVAVKDTRPRRPPHQGGRLALGVLHLHESISGAAGVAADCSAQPRRVLPGVPQGERAA